MAKRSGFQYRPPRSKKPKLNLTRNGTPPPQHNIDWGDDEDEEFIMLASQAAEKVEANAEMVLSQAMHMNNTTLNYDNFRRNASSSTQIRRPMSVIDEFMQDDDLFAEIPDDVVAATQPPKPASTLLPPPLPPPPASVPQQSEDLFSASMSSAAVIAVPQSQQQRVENAKMTAQNTYLSNRVRDQKREIESLKEALAKLNEKCQTKEGEASTLRYELQANRQQSDTFRKDKLAEIEKRERDFVERVAALEKTVEKQQTEIQFKHMEIMNRKSRRSLNETMPPPPPPVEREPSAKTKNHNMFKLMSHSYVIEKSIAIGSPMPRIDFKQDDTMSGLSPNDAMLLRHLCYLQRLNYEVVDLKNLRYDSTIVIDIVVSIAELSKWLWDYSQRLDCNQSRTYDVTTEHKRLSQSISTGTAFNQSASQIRCLDEKPCVAGEKLMYERRIVAVLSLLCRKCCGLTNRLLDAVVDLNDTGDEIDDEPNVRSFVDLFTSILTDIAFSKTSHLHRGFVEASSLLLTAMAGKFTSNEKRNTSLLNIFMAIIYCKPDLIALHQLTDYLGGASKVYCNELCRGKQSGISNYTHLSIRRYSSESCPLQVYAVLLEVAFQPNLQSKTHTELTACISLLTKITVGLMRFMRNCFKCSATWLFQLNDAATEMSSSTSCYCHCYMVRATIVLLHLCVKHWIRDRKCIDAKVMGNIFEMAVLFLHDNFKIHHERRVLFGGGLPIKNRLQFIYDSIVFYHNLFPFGNSHLQALKSLDLQLKILMHEPQRPSPEQQLQQQQSNRTMNGMANGSQVLANIFDRFTLK